MPGYSCGVYKQPKRQMSTSAAIIVGGIIVSAGVLLAFSAYGIGASRTVAKVVTTTATGTTTTTTTAGAPISSVQLYEVIFNESALCYTYADEWAVTLGSITQSQPSNMTFPFSGRVGFSSAAEMISKIVFTVPDGRYNFNVSRSADSVPANGTVNVSGSNVVVQIRAEPLCPISGQG
jgi:hypothetical protein